MSPSDVLLPGFAYGEELDTFGQRSLGYRLLAPSGGASWGLEVETLARRLQAAPYPDHWPAADLFCSVLLSGCQRVIAVARYGLSDHTPGGRRGGFELFGVVAPVSLSVSETLAVYRGLVRRRAGAEDLHALGEPVRLSVVRGEDVSPPAARSPRRASPFRMWQDAAILYGATSHADPNDHLHLLESDAHSAWQWLPFVGHDFPLNEHAQHGPVVACTPHTAAMQAADECQLSVILRLPFVGEPP